MTVAAACLDEEFDAPESGELAEADVCPLDCFVEHELVTKSLYSPP